MGSLIYTLRPSGGPIRFLNFVMLSVTLSLIAGFRGEVNDLDSRAYSLWYLNMEGSSLTEFFDRINNSLLFYDDGVNKFEVGFALLGFVFESLGGSFSQFIMFCAAFSITVKLACMFRYVKGVLPLLACIVWYFTWQFLLMEMNAIRVGFALSIVLLGFKYFVIKSWKAIPFIFFGALFHISVVLLLFLNPSDRLKFLKRRYFVFLLLLSVVLGYLPMHEIVNFFFGSFSKISTYYDGVVSDGLFSDINRFNLIVILRLFVFFGLLVLYKRFCENPVATYGFQSFFLSFCFYFAFASFPVFAGRLFELFGFLSVFAIAQFVSSVRPVIISSGFVFLISLLQLYAIVYYSRLVNLFYFIDVPSLHVDLVTVPVIQP